MFGKVIISYKNLLSMGKYKNLLSMGREIIVYRLTGGGVFSKFNFRIQFFLLKKVRHITRENPK